MAAICNNCGGTLLYSPKRSAMFCKKCGSSFKAEEIGDITKELVLESKIRSYRDVYGADEDDLYDCHIYTCNHCGADIILNGTETSTVCIYCGSPSIVFSRIEKQQKPEGIIPFKISRDEAYRILKEKIGKSRFTPSSLKDVKPTDIRGIYIPYWIVNADFYGTYEITSREDEGRNSRTYVYARAASAEFKAMPFDASTKLNDALSQKLEPYFFEEAKTFDEDYLSGFYSDKSDLTLEGLRSASIKRMGDMLGGELSKPIQGMILDCKLNYADVSIHDDSVYLLLPSWFYTFVHEGKPYTILINGQTGKAVGVIPPDKNMVKIKTILTFLLLAIPFILLPVISYIWLGNLRLTDAVIQLLTNILLFICLFPLTAAFMGIKKLNEFKKAATSASTFNYVNRRQE